MIERRNFRARAAVVECVVTKVLRSPTVLITVDMLRAWCDIPAEAADRILAKLKATGLVRETTTGVFERCLWAGAERLWPLSAAKPSG